MKHLWTPWRMAFIKESKAAQGCVLCELQNQNDGVENLILFRSTHSYIIMNKYPYNPGHLMVVPLAHENNFSNFSIDALTDMGLQTQRAYAGLKKTMNPAGFNMGMNLGPISGAGIPDHLHTHIVPRWSGDTNFMPIIGQTKVMPETLEETYLKLRVFFS